MINFNFLAKHGLIATPQDPCVYTTQTAPIILLAIFVDDGLIASPNRAQTDLILQDMDDIFKIQVDDPEEQSPKVDLSRPDALRGVLAYQIQLW
jgi:hypothetical protein